jgi:hypothetical protein
MSNNIPSQYSNSQVNTLSPLLTKTWSIPRYRSFVFTFQPEPFDDNLSECEIHLII